MLNCLDMSYTFCVGMFHHLCQGAPVIDHILVFKSLLKERGCFFVVVVLILRRDVLITAWKDLEF